MKIERYYSNSPEPLKSSEGSQPIANGTQSSAGETTEATPLPAERNAARSHAASQKGNLDMYGFAQRWKLSSQTPQNTPNRRSQRNDATADSDSQSMAQFRMQSLSAGISDQPGFASLRRNAISRPAQQSDQPSFASQRRNAISRSSVQGNTNPTPEGNVRIATPGNEPADSYRSPKSTSNDQGFTLNNRRSNLARGSGGLTAYGEGKTINESSNSVKSWDRTFAKGDGYAVKGEAAALESRSRTYEYDSGLGVGAQAEASLIRGKVGVQATTSHMVGGAEVVGASGYAEVDGMVGARATAEAGVGVGRDGLPAVRVGAEAFAGARVDTRVGGEARLMGIGADATATTSTMAGAQANTEATLGVAGMQASASAFAGASVGTSGSASVAGVGASGSAEAWAGVGAKAELDAGYTDGKLQFKFGAGAALGVGGALSSGFTWDLNQTKTDAERFAHNTEQLVSSEMQKVTPALNNAAQEAGRLATTAAEQAEAGFHKAASTTTQAAQAASQEVAKLSSNVEQTVTTTATTVANVLNTSASTAANTVANTAAKTATTATKTVSSAAKTAGKTATNIAKSIFKLF